MRILLQSRSSNDEWSAVQKRVNKANRGKGNLWRLPQGSLFFVYLFSPGDFNMNWPLADEFMIEIDRWVLNIYTFVIRAIALLTHVC